MTLPVKRDLQLIGSRDYQREVYDAFMAAKATPKIVSEYVRSVFETWRAEGRTYDAIAKDLNVAKPTIVNVVKYNKGAGPKIELALAELRFDGSIDALREEALHWYNSHAAERAANALRDPRLAAVLEMGRVDGFDAEILRDFEAQHREIPDTTTAGDLWLSLLNAQSKVPRRSRALEDIARELPRGATSPQSKKKRPTKNSA